MSEFADKASAVVHLGDPAADPPMTVRVHPDDKPYDPDALRAVKLSGRGPWAASWVIVTGSPVDLCEPLGDAEVAAWPVTHSHQYRTAFRHVDADRVRQGKAPQSAERGDMDVSAFKGDGG